VNSNKLLKADLVQFPVRVTVVMFLCHRKYWRAESMSIGADWNGGS